MIDTENINARDGLVLTQSHSHGFKGREHGNEVGSSKDGLHFGIFIIVKIAIILGERSTCNRSNCYD